MVSGKTKTSTTQGGLISYLAKLGLGDEDLTRVISLLHTGTGESAPLPKQREELIQALPEGGLLESKFEDKFFTEQDLEARPAGRSFAYPSSENGQDISGRGATDSEGGLPVLLQ